MKTTIALTLLSLVTLTLVQPAKADGLPPELSPELNLLIQPFNDTNYIAQATADSLLEIQLGQLAQTNSTNTAVRQFGQKLVADHTLALQQAQPLLTAYKLPAPTLDTNQLAIVQILQSLTNTQFDVQFVAANVAGHIKDIKESERAAVRSLNVDVRNYARTQLPVLVNHLVIALQIRESFIPASITTTNTPNTNTNTATGTNTPTKPY